MRSISGKGSVLLFKGKLHGQVASTDRQDDAVIADGFASWSRWIELGLKEVVTTGDVDEAPQLAFFVRWKTDRGNGDLHRIADW